MFNKERFKTAIFNGLATVYAASLVAYLFGVALGFDKEYAIQHMTMIGATAVAAAVAMTALSLALNLRWFTSPKFLIAVFVSSLAVSLLVTRFSFAELFDEQGTAGAARLFTGLVQINTKLLPEAVAEVVETIFVAFLATAISVPLAFVLAFFCAKNVMVSPAAFAVYAMLRTVLNLTRSIEPLIWAVIFSVWVGIGPFAGMLALMIHSVASLAKQYSEIMETVEEGPIDGIRATGANQVQVIWFGIVPQVILPSVAFTFYRWDINVRMATVIGLAGGGGIGTLLLKYQGQAMWPEVGAIILVIAIVVWIMDTASAYVREAMR